MDVLWADAEVVSLSFDYDSLRLTLRESTGATVVVSGEGVLGVEAVGLWDEVIVERGEISAGHDFAGRCWNAIRRRYGNQVPESGSPARNTRSFQTLMVTLIDGAVIQAAATSFMAQRSAGR